MISSGAKSKALEQAKTRADTLYEEASSITLNGDWKAAVKKVDPAYRVLEKPWNEAGIDLGV